MRRLREAGVDVGLMLAPVIPGLNDRDIPAIIEQAAAAGARDIGVIPLRLAGNVRNVFLERLRAELPDHAKRVEARIRDMRGGAYNNSNFGDRMRGTGAYWDGVLTLIEKTAGKHGMAFTRSAGEAKADRMVKQKGERSQDAATVGVKKQDGIVQLPLF
ncbi:MAG: hypothetical protein KDA32_14485, partial [Phycisphaerales bacterium]|nr:hypothetical protein [Phycisphaerales bacterium]